MADVDFCGSPKPVSVNDTTQNGVMSIEHVVAGQETCTAIDMYAQDMGGSRNANWFAADRGMNFKCKGANGKGKGGRKGVFAKVHGADWHRVDYKFKCITYMGCGDICQNNYWIPPGAKRYGAEWMYDQRVV